MVSLVKRPVSPKKFERTIRKNFSRQKKSNKKISESAILYN
jgi:hypothetical protein